MKKIVLYQHAGSQNHGCEALVRTITQAIKNTFSKVEVKLASFEKNEDVKYGVNGIVDNIVPHGIQIKRFNLNWWKLQFAKAIHSTKLYNHFLTDFDWLKKNANIDCYVAIGGDNYCYDSGKTFYCYDEKIARLPSKKALLGCSIEPDDLNEQLVNSLRQFDLITARETITYNALVKAGGFSDLRLIPDSAFRLPTVCLDLPEGFQEGNTIGINVSPLILQYEQVENATFNNYCALIEYIIKETQYQIALIPHVVWKSSDDRSVLMRLYECFSDTGRVVLVDDCNCTELKGYICRCEMFIGARTHATIAAYSSCVPTLVVGYSVKAKGIAQDLFGDYKQYVIPVQTLKSKVDLIEAFNWLNEHKSEIKSHLQNIIPSYINRIDDLEIALKEVLE